MKARLTRVVRFCAAHRYHRPDWSEEQNATAFGACANAPGHGHNYECSVTVEGRLAPDTSMIMPLADLDAILESEVVRRFDHSHINDAAPEFGPGGMIPTAEALAVYVWQAIEPRLPEGVSPSHVRVREDATLYAEYWGED